MGKSIERMMNARDHQYEIMLWAFKKLRPDSVVGITDRAIYIDDNEVVLRSLLSTEMWNEALDLYTQHRNTWFRIDPTDVRDTQQKNPTSILPQFGERLLLLILTKEDRVNIPGDLEEEFKQIAAKHGARYVKLWYYKQVAASAWPMIRKAAGWGLLASIGAWIRRYI